MPEPVPFGRLGSVLRIEPAPGRPGPSGARVAVATVVSLAGSLGADAALAALATTTFPSTRGYPHFRFGDYATLTVIGVLVACAAWPVVARVTRSPRWLFLRLAVAVTLVLWLPDVWLLAHHQPAQAVAWLMAMHLAVALVTYNALVRLAPVPGNPRAGARRAGPAGTAPAPPYRAPGTAATGGGRSAWTAMVVLVVVELVAGVAALVLVPTGRPSGLVPPHDQLVYAVHALLGPALLLGAVALVVHARHRPRMLRTAAAAGLAGVVVGGAGGLLTASHSLRLLGIGLMLVGSVLAGFAYLVGVVEPDPRPAPSAAPPDAA